jgi:hypothetical protein
MKRNTTGLFIAALLMLWAGSVLAQANFAGTWVFDPKLSQGVPEGVGMTMVVKQAGDRVEIETDITTPDGQQKIADLYILDGKEIDYKPPVMGPGAGKGRRTSKWTADRKGFEVTEKATIDGPDGLATVSATRKWTLSGDGKTLTMDVAMTTPEGERVSKRIFTKKG